MQKDQIRQKLINYLEAYRKNAGAFNSLAVIHDFIDFIKSEPYTFAVIKPYLKYIEEQTAIMEKSIDQFESFGPIIDQALLDKLPVFRNEIEQVQKAIAEGKAFESKPKADFSLSLSDLLLIHKLIANLPKFSKEKINSIYEFPDINMILKLIPNHNFITPNSAILGNCMTTVVKKIINKIDGEYFLTKGKANRSISFDVQTSELNVKGNKVKISRRGDPSTDHFILQAIFECEDIGEEIDFKDIALDYIKMNEYDGTKDWQRFRRACDYLNKKIDKATNGEVKEFILYHTGKTGWCKINPKYL